jgi:predicted PurR-regulated permease PerM
VGPERTVTFRPRTILTSAAVLFALAAVITIVWVARHAISWVLISLFFALALNPAVEWVQRRGIRRRGAATATIYLFALAVFAGLGALLIPVMVSQVGDLIDAAPGYVDDFTEGRGWLGDLNEEYNISDRVREAFGSGEGTEGAGGGLAADGAGTALELTRGIATGVFGVVTIVFMTLFMLLEGPAWIERFYNLLSPESEARWRRVGHGIYKTIGGYISGNLLISVIAGVVTSVVLLILDVPYALALGFVVALLDLIPLAGATLAR